MFYQVMKNGISQVEPEKISDRTLTIGYLKAEELMSLNYIFGFDKNTVLSCEDANSFFRSGAEVHQDYTFTELRIMNAPGEQDDYIALYMKKNLVLVVDILDEDGSTLQKFTSAAQKYSVSKISEEKVVAAFLDSLISGENAVLESFENQLTKKEEEIFHNQTGKNFNLSLLHLKKSVSRRQTYYSQLLDIAQAVIENDNDIFSEDRLIYVDNVSKRLERLIGEAANLRSTVEHLQDAYTSYLDTNMNSTMKLFTVLTSIFFPLTIIVGWYGMNFTHMPELTWKYGYVYVILLSAVTIFGLVVLGKRKKWF